MAEEQEMRWVDNGRRKSSWGLVKLHPSHHDYAKSLPWAGPGSKPGDVADGSPVDTGSVADNKAIVIDEPAAPRRGRGRPPKAKAVTPVPDDE